MSVSDFVQRPPSMPIPRKADIGGIIPRFFTQEIETDQIHPETGLKVYRIVEFLELLIPGDKGNAPVKRVTDHIKREYADAYRAFKERGAGADMIGDGIPLKLWGGIKSEVARGLENINVFTVQQLAGLSDQQCSHPGTIGLRDIRQKARDFLESASKTAPLAAMQAELEDLKKKLELRDSQLQQALDKANELQAQANTMNGISPSEPKLTTPRERANKEK